MQKFWKFVLPNAVIKDSALPLRQECVVVREPHIILQQWLAAALRVKKNLKPRTACLATVDTASNQPTIRLLRIEDTTESGLKFYTNYDGRKANEISKNPNVSVLFHWPLMQRSVRIEGLASKLTIDESNEYFQNLPRDVQQSIRSGKQCSLERRTLFDQMAVHLLYMLNNQPVLMPDNWGGFLVQPKMYEFWQLDQDSLYSILRFHKAKQSIEQPLNSETCNQSEYVWNYEYMAPN